MKYFILSTHHYPAFFVIGKGPTPEHVIRQATQHRIPVIRNTCRELNVSERYSYAGHMDVDLLPGCRAENGMIV